MELTKSIEEGRKYGFHILNLKNSLDKKLSTTTTTTAIVSDEIEKMPILPILSDDVIKKYIDHEEEMNIKLNPEICCPELVGTNLTVDTAYVNGKCGKLVAAVATERIDMHEL